MSEKYLKRTKKGKGREKKKAKKWIKENLPSIISKAKERAERILDEVLKE